MPERDRHTGQRLAAKALDAWFSGRTGQVEPAIREAIAARPQTALAALAFIVALEQPERAGILLRRALETNGETVRRIEGLQLQGRHSIALSLAEKLVLHSPGHADAPARVCRIHLAKGDRATARRIADDLVCRFPSDRMAWQSLAMVALEADDMTVAQEAEGRLRALFSDDMPPEAKDIFLRARVLARAGSLDEASRLADAAQRAAISEAEAAEAAVHRARIARLRGDQRMAAAILESVIGTGPGDADVIAELGDTLRELGLDRQAAGEARRVLRIVPDHRKALRCLAHALSRSGDTEAATDAFMRLLDIDPNDQDAIYGLEMALHRGTVPAESEPPAASPDERAMAMWARGKRLRRQCRPREAMVLLERALAANPTLSGAAEDLGWCLLDLGRPGLAAEAFEAARMSGSGRAAAGAAEAEALRAAIEEPAPSCSPKHPFERLVEGCAIALTQAGSSASADPVDITIEAAIFVTNSAIGAGQRPLAARFARAALDRSPDHPALRLLNAECLVATEQYAEARSHLRSLMEEGWTTGGIHHLSAICANACGDFTKAEADLVMATAATEHLGEYPGRLGDLRLHQGNPAGAVMAFREAVRRMPSFAMAHQNYAARNDHTQYAMSGLEPDFPDDVLLADGFNRSGEGRVHVGDTIGSNRLFGEAIAANRRLGKDFRLSDDLVEALGLEVGGPVRILPHEWVIQIGHMAMLDTWLKIGALGWRPPATGILLAPARHVVNRTYLDCWRPFFTVVEDPVLIERLVPLQRFVGECFNGWVGKDGRPEAFTDVGARAHVAWDDDGRASLLQLTPELHARGRAALESLGMEEGAWFVAVHIRGSGFHAEGAGSSQDHRNAGIDAYMPAIDMITKRGGWVVRMGDRSMPRLPERARVIDYAHCPLKSDWMDVFLCGAARCYLGTTSGLANVAISFGTPSVLVNCLSNYAQLWPGNVTFTWRPYWSGREGRYLSLAEILAEPTRGATFSGNLLSGLDLVARDNDAEDIRSALEEVLDTLDGRGSTEESGAVRLWRDAAAPTTFFGNARPARGFAERSRRIFFPDA